MNLSLILALSGAASLAAIAALFLIRRNSKSRAVTGNKPCQEAASPVSPACQWIAERRLKLEGKLAELQALVEQLQTSGQWTPEDERRLQKVRAEVEDYLSAVSASAEENLYSYRQLFHSGPYTTVPFTNGGWSISWGVWMADAHIELLLRHATTRMKIAALDGEKQEYEKRFLAEVENRILQAGFDECPYFPRYKMENVARTVCRSRLTRFEETPFGLTAERAVDQLRVADSLPDIGEMSDQMPARQPEDYVRLFNDYRTAMDRSWRVLTLGEKSSVLAAMTEPQ